MGIDFYGNPDTSLLPQEIVLFMTAFKDTPRLRETAQVDDVALCEWRRLGVFLLSGPKSKTVQLRNAGLRIEAMLMSLDEILSPFAEPVHTGDGNERRLENLRRLLEIGADFGVLLFGQPCGWELNWTVRPSDEAHRELEILHSGQLHSSKIAEQVTNAASSQYQPLHNEPEPQPVQPQRKRRRRLGRSHSLKKKESQEQPHGQRCPPSSLQTQIERPMEENIGAALHPTITGESDIQRLHKQRQHPSDPYHQQFHHQRSTKQGEQSLSLRPRSDSDFPRIHYQESLHHGNKQNVPTTQKEIETPDPHSCKDEIEDKALPTFPKDNAAVKLEPNEHLAKLPERPQTRSRETRPEESFLDGSEESRVTTEQPLAAPTSQTGRPIIYFPALVKIKDEYGCKLSQPIMVLEPVVDRSFLATF